MATLDDAVGGADANTYILQPAATLYFADVIEFSATWVALDTGVMDQWLITATRAVDRFRFKSSKNATAQALEFPRASQEDTTEIPQRIINFQLLMLIYLFHTANATTGKVPNFIARAKVEGVVEVEFREARGSVRKAFAGELEAARAEARDWLISPSVILVVK